jgi:hypothetical protein
VVVVAWQQVATDFGFCLLTGVDFIRQKSRNVTRGGFAANLLHEDETTMDYDDDVTMEDALYPWLAADDLADPTSGAWDGEEPQDEQDGEEQAEVAL